MIYLDNAATTLHKPEQVIEAVADAICWCVMYPDKAEEIARQGYLDTKELTWERNAEHYVQLFKELSDRN